MNTMTTTTASTVSRFLKAQGFERYNGQIGFKVEHTEIGSPEIIVIAYHYNNGYACNIGPELEAAGYVVTRNYTSGSWQNPALMVTICTIDGKVAA